MSTGGIDMVDPHEHLHYEHGEWGRWHHEYTQYPGSGDVARFCLLRRKKVCTYNKKTGRIWTDYNEQEVVGIGGDVDAAKEDAWDKAHELEERTEGQKSHD